MSKVNIPIVGGAYKDPHTAIACQTCINMYAEPTQDGIKSQGALLSAKAVNTLYDANKEAMCRGFKMLSNGIAYAIYGNELYKLDDGFEVVPDVFIEGTNQIVIAENSRYAAFVSDNIVYTLDIISNTWAQYGEQLLYAADDVTTLSQRFIFNRRGTGQIFWSDTLSTNIDPLSFATAEASPDDVTALKSHQKQLWIFGELTTEVWYPTGDKDLPFAPIQGVGIDAGCLLPQTIRKFGESLIWVANTENGTNQVVMTQGYQLQRISNHALEKALNSYDTKHANAYVYQDEGHNFYVLNLPEANKTWVFDSATSLWHERAIFKDDKFQTHPAKYHVLWKGKHVFAHADQALLMGLTNSGVDKIGDESLTQVRERATHALSRTPHMIRHNRLTLIAQQAVGTHELNPQVMLSWSDDDGVTWSDSRWRGLGKRGQYQYRTFWTRLGASRNRAYRFRFTDAAELTITNAEIEVS